MSAPRYNLSGYDRGVEAATDGAWVRAYDHDAVVAERDRLREALSETLWMADEWYEHNGSSSLENFDGSLGQALERAAAALQGDG